MLSAKSAKVISDSNLHKRFDRILDEIEQLANIGYYGYFASFEKEISYKDIKVFIGKLEELGFKIEEKALNDSMTFQISW